MTTECSDHVATLLKPWAMRCGDFQRSRRRCPCRPQRSLAVADRLIALSSALSSSPAADRTHATACFWPALRALSTVPDQCRDADRGSDGADSLQSAAALLARLCAVVAVRQRTLRNNSVQLAGDDERLLAAVVACRADFQLAQQLREQAAKGSDASRARTPSAAGGRPAADSAAALAAAEDARTLLDRRAAAALTEFLIDEPRPAAAGSDRHAQLWLTLHTAIGLLRLQGAHGLLSCAGIV